MLQNSGFRAEFLSRLSLAMEGVLSDENVNACIDRYVELLDKEVPAERQRWEGDYDGWMNSVGKLRTFIAQNHLQRIVLRLRAYMALTEEEEQRYFGRWI